MENLLKNRMFYRLMARSTVKRRIFLASLLALSWSCSAWADPETYQSRYSVYRNGKLTGKLELRLVENNGQWEIHSEASGTHGLARILKARDRELVTGRVADGRFVPTHYTRQTRVAGVGDRWETTFDWDADEATVVHKGKETFVLPLGGEALDPLSLKLELSRRLGEPEPDLNFLLVDEDEIDPQKFRILEREWLETSLGCLETVPVEKVREHNRRYTRAWHAPEFGNVQVRVEHGKRGGDHMEFRITELEFDGAEISPRPGCSALQSADPNGAAGGL